MVCMLQTAIQLWPQLQATGLPLVSPAVASNADVPGSWLDQFMASAASNGLRVDYIGLHWSGSNFDTATAVSQLQQYIQAVYKRYSRPIWLTQVSFQSRTIAGVRTSPDFQQEFAGLVPERCAAIICPA